MGREQVSQRRFDVITIGDMCVDLVLDLGEVMPRFGQVEQWVPDYYLEMGGSTCLFACQAAKLGLRTAILGRVGDDAYGELVVRRLRESGVDTDRVVADSRLKTGLGVALCRAGGDRSILTYAGSLNAVYPSDVTDEFLSSARHLHYGSYYLQTNLLPRAAEIMARAREFGLTVSLDTNWDPEGRWDGGLTQALAHVDVILPNQQEALAITGMTDVEDAVTALLTRVPVVAVKLGERGSLAATEGERSLVPVPPVARVVDTIGAGDSFDAGFLAGWLSGLSLAQSAAIGNACGRATTQAAGGLQGQLLLPDIAHLRELIE
ncbi:MAG: carbohydrate kinase family protein [Anaerolineae bacterium]|nr:carbohydrate kinase family protein [Anaerolineae bacterium]